MGWGNKCRVRAGISLDREKRGEGRRCMGARMESLGFRVQIHGSRLQENGIMKFTVWLRVCR